MTAFTFLVSLLLASPFLPEVAAQNLAAIKAYTPSFAQCPDNFTLVRLAGSSPTTQSLSADEGQYVSSRRSDVLTGAWKDYLANVQGVKGIEPLPPYVASILNGDSSNQPTLGIATSGGGYRAAIFGAGVLNVLDGRNSTSTSVGTGGLLQAATYLAGLSGGSWLVVSLAQANFPTIAELVFGPSTNSSDSNVYGGWNAQFDPLAPSNNVTLDDEYDIGLVTEISGKKAAGFPVSINDVWARALSRNFVNGTTADNFLASNVTHGAGLLYSDISQLPSVVSHSQPFLIVVADSLSSSQNKSNILPEDYTPISNPIYEFNLYETGSFDPVLSAFIPTKFLGTVNTSSCVTGFDQTAFITATSAELFNEYNTSAQALANSSIGPLFTLLNISIPQPGVELDVANYPNPFFGVANTTFIDAQSEYLSLIDGGEDGEVLPIQPLLVKARGVDVIFAIDATDDNNDFTAGSSLIATQARAALYPSAYSFPAVPTTTSTFISQGLVNHPTFFGCNATSDEPLLIYLANGGPPPNQPPLTNTSTSQLAYQPAQIQAMLDQTFVIATQGIPTPSAGSSAIDPDWPACLACAVVDRARNRTGVARSGICADCFERYCWSEDTSSNGTSPGSGSGSGSGSTPHSGSLRSVHIGGHAMILSTVLVGALTLLASFI